MTSIKVKFRPSTIAEHDGTVYYQIIHSRKCCQINSGITMSANSWEGLPSISIEMIRHDVLWLNSIAKRWEADGLCFSAIDLAREFRQLRYKSQLSLYIKSQIKQLSTDGRQRTAETYAAAMRSFREFLATSRPIRHDNIECDIQIGHITPGLIDKYQYWLRKRGVTLNTMSFYNRILRAIYNRAVEEFGIENSAPFKRAYTGIAKTRKRALPISVVRDLNRLDLSNTPHLDYARDMFMLSFYLRGMSFIDMAFLKKTDLRNNYISYRRRKTGKPLLIYWTHEMQAIVDKYPKNPTEYLLPIITCSNSNDRRTYIKFTAKINRQLKAIALRIGLTFPLTMYVARHSWASAAKMNGIPISIISEGLGHNSESTTQIYLASLDTSVVDKANDIIISSLR